MMKMMIAAVYAVLLSGVPASAFQDTDLEIVARKAQSALGPGYRAQLGNNKRLVLLCPDCEGLNMITIQLGRQTDGTEGRVRSGQTSIADLEKQCQAREPSCRIERADTRSAVGWLSTYRNGNIAGNTLVLLRNGDMLQVRSDGNTPAAARENLRRLQRTVIPDIIKP
jgi:hypothetical protein